MRSLRKKMPMSAQHVKAHDITRKLRQKMFLTGTDLLTAGRGDCWVIDPDCEFMRSWDLVTIAALCFTAVVTPYEVALLEPQYDALFVVNRVIDFAFVMDMGVQFRLMYFERQTGRWVKTPRQIVRNYLTSWFAVDFVSIIPFDLISLLLESGDAPVAATPGAGSDASGIGKMKILRTIRLLRLMKMFRILRAMRIFTRWQTSMSMSYGVLGLLQFAFAMVFVSHWLACAWVLMDTMQDGTVPTWYTNWACVDPGNGQPPVCKSTPAWDKYAVSLYWSVMTITSIGYGDILPTNRSEHLLCVVFMLIGASFWAYIIGSACSILASLNVDTLAFRQNMDHLNYFIHDQKISFSMAKELRALFLKSRSLQRINNYKHLYTCCCCCCCYCALQLPCSPTPQLALATALPGTTACRRSCAGASHCTAPPGWSRRCITSRTATKASWL
jgi:potassium voltage-gated channel Eag-related subfamily H protein 7